jgi:hypothetical protein
LYHYETEQREFEHDSKNIVFGKPVVRPRRIWENNTKIDFEKISREDGRYVKLAQGHLRWHTLLLAVLIFGIYCRLAIYEVLSHTVILLAYRITSEFRLPDGAHYNK